jgi:putative mycofactocin binding protein MftB
MPDAEATAGFALDRPWTLHPDVALRPEAFGALAYNFGTRRLSFLKDRALVVAVERLAAEPTALEACRAAGISDAELPRYARALATLAAAGTVCPRAGA